MGLTTGQIVYPDGDTNLAPLHSHFAALAESVQDALDVLQSATMAPVANETARNSVYPTPVQGNRVYRLDKGFEEAYYEAYSPVSNPGGATPAGWYPVAGSDIRYSNRRSWTVPSSGSSQPILATNPTATRNDGFAAAASGAITLPYVGDYRVDLAVEWTTQNNAGQRNLGFDGTGGVVSLAGNAPYVLAPPALGGVGQTGWWTVRTSTSPGGAVSPFVVQNSGANLAAKGEVSIQYLGPSKY